MRARAWFVVACVALAGCGGRAANPVQVVQSYDRTLSCDQLQSEIAANESKVRGLAGEHKNAHDSNVGVGVIGAILFWPALFALDTNDSQKEEMSALRQRNTHLVSLMESRGCYAPTTTIQEAQVPGQPSATAGQPQVTGSQIAATTAPSLPRQRWTAQAGRDSCGKPYAMDVVLEGSRAQGYIQRGDVSYTINGTLSATGDLPSSIAGLSEPSPGNPKYLSVELDIADQAAVGTFKAFDGYHFSCETAVVLKPAVG